MVSQPPKLKTFGGVRKLFRKAHELRGDPDGEKN